MKISANGMARTALNSIHKRSELYHAKAAISCFHDALLAVAKGLLTPEQVKDFFWASGFEQAKFFGDVLDIRERKEEPAA